jgi:hypothetical protein
MPKSKMLQSLALLKVAEPSDNKFSSVRMAPMYESVTT